MPGYGRFLGFSEHAAHPAAQSHSARLGIAARSYFPCRRRGPEHVKESDGFAFDSALVWVAGLNASSHLIASQSARLLDASAGVAELMNAVSYIVLLGATLLDNARLFGQVRTLAISDSLTGLANYRRLVDILQSELERSGRTNRPFSVLLMDLDGLKKINDRHGHVIGSRALCRVAIDTASEFAARLIRRPDTAATNSRSCCRRRKVAAAEQVAERIRNCLLADEEVPQLSISIGVATFPKCGVTVQELLEFADRALYEMKEQSKRGRTEKRNRRTVSNVASRESVQEVCKRLKCCQLRAVPEDFQNSGFGTGKLTETSLVCMSRIRTFTTLQICSCEVPLLISSKSWPSVREPPAETLLRLRFR